MIVAPGREAFTPSTPLPRALPSRRSGVKGTVRILAPVASKINANGYNRLALGFEKIDPDLTSDVVGKAVDALFDQIA
jgi:hypothetical protein